MKLGHRPRIDIEKLLHWAYRDELPKRSVDTAGAVWEMAVLGVRVDKSGGEPGMPIAMGEPHRDAFIVEEAVASLPTMEASWPECRDFVAPDFGALLGDDDITITRLQVPAAVYVETHARMGNRPDWEVEGWRLRRIIGRNGRVQVEGLASDGHVRTGAYCATIVEPDPREIVADRVIYGAWWQGLTDLAAALSDSLERWIPTPPAVSPAPWLYPDAQARILPDLSKGAGFRAISPRRATRAA